MKVEEGGCPMRGGCRVDVERRIDGVGEELLLYTTSGPERHTPLSQMGLIRATNSSTNSSRSQ